MRIASIITFIALLGTARADRSIDIEQAMDRAARQHPIAREQRATLRAAEARVEAERARYVPDIELFAQLDRSTSNTSNGVMFPEPGIPVLSGTPGRTFDQGAFGSAVGVSASWDILGFRRWDAEIGAADLEARVQRDGVALTDLDRAFDVGDRFIVVIAREEAVKAARAGVERAHVFVTIVKAAVDQSLRPGADLSRAQAELSLAETSLIRAESAAKVAVEQFGEAFGSQEVAPKPDAGKLLAKAPHVDTALQHDDPRIAAATLEIDAAKARKSVIETATLPRLAVVGSLWARGGNDPGGVRADGLVPDVPNWTLGVVLTLPLLARTLVDPQARVADANIARARAHEDEVVQHEHSRAAQTSVIVDAAYRIADQTPITLAAARDADQQATARYQAKLATADDVAQAQRLLEQAEIDDAVARLDVWRAILAFAYAHGDLALFTKPYHEAGH